MISMVSLKKNDKIIVIIAVAVLVIAGIGIAAYTPPPIDINGSYTASETTYHVSWRTNSGSYPLSDDFYAGKNEPYSKDVTIDQENLLSVKIELTWTDDHTYGILRKKGLDTLFLDVTNRGQTKSLDQVGNGTMNIIFNLRNIPTIETIPADSLTEAEEKIKTEYYDNTDESFTIEVRVQTGERIFRLFKYLRDKGNDFDLKITYTYFDALVTETKDETKNTDQNTQNTDDSWEPPYLSMILKTGCGRYI